MPDNDEPKDLVLAKIDEVLARIDESVAVLHADTVQIKVLLTAIEKQLANMSKAVAAQWENFDRRAEQMRKLNDDRPFNLEHPDA